MKETKRKTKNGQSLPESFGVNLSDFALFLSVMKNKEAYECALSIILEEEDLHLKEVKVEQVVLNKSGKRAIRLDAWALDTKNRQINTEMQNDTSSDDIRKRSRYYQGLLDTPILKSGRETRYKNLPSTIIIFITQEDIFGQDLVKYTFTEQCEEVNGLHLGDGTKKIFVNMSSKNGTPEMVSLLQYMKDTKMENPDVLVKDERIVKLDSIVQEVKQAEEWEDVRMNILDYGLQQGEKIGKEIGAESKLVEQVCKKLRKGKSVTAIAEDLEEDLDVVQSICKAAETFAPEYDEEKVYEKWKEKDKQDE